MSSGTVLADFGTSVGKIFTAPLQKTPRAPDMQKNDALSAQPTGADASKNSEQQRLDEQRRASYTSTVLTGGSGTSESDQPTTSSSLLMGY